MASIGKKRARIFINGGSNLLRKMRPGAALGLAVLALSAAAPEAAPFCSPDHGGFQITKEQLGPLAELALPICHAVCAYLGDTPPKRRLALGRWTAMTGIVWKKHVRVIEGALADGEYPALRLPGWAKFRAWLDAVAHKSEAMQIKALSAPIWEATWVGLQALGDGLLGDIQPKPVAAGGGADGGPGYRGQFATLLPAATMAAQVLQYYKQAGRLDEAERFFREVVLGYEEGAGVFPFRWFFDTADFRRVSAFPFPGLRKLTWPDPHDVLPTGVAEALLAAHPAIAAEAAAADVAQLLAEQEDAYESIADKQQWTKLTLYTATGGWDDALCTRVPTICSTLRGRLQTEHEPAHSLYQSGMFPAGDEAVILFRIGAGGMAHLHTGQDSRINVHFCLLHCNSSTLVAAGEARDYADGSLFAFEDRADHEIINRDQANDRIMLTVGVLHPDRLARAEPFPSPQQVPPRHALWHEAVWIAWLIPT
jgi:hypothetical protein